MFLGRKLNRPSNSLLSCGLWVRSPLASFMDLKTMDKVEVYFIVMHSIVFLCASAFPFILLYVKYKYLNNLRRLFVTPENFKLFKLFLKNNIDRGFRSGYFILMFIFRFFALFCFYSVPIVFYILFFFYLVCYWKETNILNNRIGEIYDYVDTQLIKREVPD